MSTTANDIYVSRVSAPAGIIPREDPVVYRDIPTSQDGPLTPERLGFYEGNGFLCFPDLFAERELRAFQEELHKLRNLDKIKRAPEVVLEPEGDEVRSIFAIHNTNPLFHRLSRDRRLLDVVCYLLNSRVYIHQSRINYKPGFRGKDFYWHSDFETWHMEDGMPRMRAISCSISLTENNEFNGPLLLIPGSHKHYLPCVGETPENHHLQSLRKQQYGVPAPESLQKLVDEGGIVSAKGPAGSVTFFECNEMHGSSSNITPWPRSNVFIVYNSIENALMDPFCGLRPRPEYIASRNFTPVEPL